MPRLILHIPIIQHILYALLHRYIFLPAVENGAVLIEQDDLNLVRFAALEAVGKIGSGKAQSIYFFRAVGGNARKLARTHDILPVGA